MMLEELVMKNNVDCIQFHCKLFVQLYLEQEIDVLQQMLKHYVVLYVVQHVVEYFVYLIQFVQDLSIIVVYYYYYYYSYLFLNVLILLQQYLYQQLNLHKFFVYDDNVLLYHHQDVQQYVLLHYV
jgi:hypothetical protein